MFKINTFDDSIHFEDGRVLFPPYSSVDYQEYADWVISGNSPEVYYEEYATVPEKVSRFQARAALLDSNLLDSVTSIMQSPQTPAIVKLAWEDAQEFRRDSPTVMMLGNLLGLNDAQLDELFIKAESIKA